MVPIESLEPRQLFAATGLDATFGTNGAVTLPGVTLGNAVLSVTGSLFVEANSKTTEYLYKLTSAGTVDTTFGTNGRIATPNFNVDQLVYDARYNLLYAAGVTPRFSDAGSTINGNVATLRVQRFDAVTGATDTTFADAGMASFVYGKTNTTQVNQIDIGRLQPLAKRGLAVAFDHTSYVHSSIDPETDTTDVTLLKFNADGTRDASFGRRGIVNVATGTSISSDTPAAYHETLNTANFADLQLRDDGSFRVLTSGTRGKRSVDNDDEGHETNNTKFMVQSTVFTAAGKVDAAQQMTWRAGTTTPADAIGIVPGVFEPLLVQASGTDGAVVVGIRFTGQVPGEAYTKTPTVTTLTPAARTVARLRIPADRFFDTILPFARGYYAVNQSGDNVSATKFKPDFRLTPSYNGGAETDTPVTADNDGFVATDVDGKLLVLHGNQVTRISGEHP